MRSSLGQLGRAGKEVDSDFLHDWLVSGRETKSLAEDNIFSYEDLAEKYETMRAIEGNLAEIMPDEDDKEAWDAIINERKGIPTHPEDYSEDIFEGIDFIEEGESGEIEKNDWRNYFYSNGYSPEQARNHMVDQFEKHTALEAQKKEEAIEYIRENKKILRTAFGVNYKERLGTVTEVLKQTPSFASFQEEFKNTEVLNSANFYQLLNDLIARNVTLQENKETQKGISLLSDDNLEAYLDKVIASKAYSKSYQHGSAKQQKIWRKAEALIEEISQEKIKRGLV